MWIRPDGGRYLGGGLALDDDGGSGVLYPGVVYLVTEPGENCVKPLTCN